MFKKCIDVITGRQMLLVHLEPQATFDKDLEERHLRCPEGGTVMAYQGVAIPTA